MPRAIAPSTVGMPVAPTPAQNVIDPTRFAVVIDGVIAVPQVSQQFLNSPSGKRIVLGFRNSSPTDGANIYIGFGTDASANSWMQLRAASSTTGAPGTTVLFDEVIPQDQLYMFADAANAQLSYIYADIDM